MLLPLLCTQGPRCPLQTRILFHCSHKLGDETKLMQYHQQLTESIEDQLSLASIHFQRSHYQVYRQGIRGVGGLGYSSRVWGVGLQVGSGAVGTALQVAMACVHAAMSSC